MATFKSFEPKQFGIPTGRYSRHLVRTNALTQDSNCLQVAAPVVAPPAPAARLGWAAGNNTAASGYLAPNAGTRESIGQPETLYFALVDQPAAGDTGVYTVTSVFSGDTTGWAVNFAAGVGQLQIPVTQAGTIGGGSAILTLRRNGVAVGSLQAVTVVAGSQGNAYEEATWIAYSPV